MSDNLGGIRVYQGSTNVPGLVLMTVADKDALIRSLLEDMHRAIEAS